MTSLHEIPDDLLLDHGTNTLAPPLAAVTAGLYTHLVTDGVVMHVAVRLPRRGSLVTDGTVVPVVVSQHGRGSVAHAEAEAVTVDMYAAADLAVTGLGCLSVPEPHPDMADALGAVTAAAAAGSAPCPNAGTLKGPSCLRGWGSDQSPRCGWRVQAALPWTC